MYSLLLTKSFADWQTVSMFQVRMRFLDFHIRSIIGLDGSTSALWGHIKGCSSSIWKNTQGPVGITENHTRDCQHLRPSALTEMATPREIDTVQTSILIIQAHWPTLSRCHAWNAKNTPCFDKLQTTRLEELVVSQTEKGPGGRRDMGNLTAVLRKWNVFAPGKDHDIMKTIRGWNTRNTSNLKPPTRKYRVLSRRDAKGGIGTPKSQTICPQTRGPLVKNLLTANGQ